MCETERSGKAMSDPLQDSSRHALGFNTNPRTINWERLEFMRLKKLNLGPERYSRHFQRFQRKEFTIGEDGKGLGLSPSNECKKSNSLAPFKTVEKPTCGYFFSRGTDNRKRNFGIPPTNLVRWRSFVGQ